MRSRWNGLGAAETALTALGLGGWEWMAGTVRVLVLVPVPVPAPVTCRRIKRCGVRSPDSIDKGDGALWWCGSRRPRPR